MGMVDEKRSSEYIHIVKAFVGAQSESNGFDMVLETSSEDGTNAKDSRKLNGVKRERSTDDEQQSSLVHVTYRLLPRRSKKKLEEVLLGWSEWHSQLFKKDSGEELESGEETYFPPLHLGADISPTLSFLSDVPLIKKHCKGLTAYDKELVPLYDRGYAAPLCSNDSGYESKRGLVVREDTRCFNCGSYDHSLRDCSKPRDNDTIANARKQHQAKKKGNGRPRIRTRYFQGTPAGKYDGLKRGSLSAETRQLLGIGERDPPPWHARMQELGYPPGYTGMEAEAEEQPSGLTIIIGEETVGVENTDIIVSGIPEKAEIRTAGFPGMNSLADKNSDPEKLVAFHQQGVDIPTRKPNFLPESDLYYRRQMPDPLRADRDSRFSRNYGDIHPIQSFCDEMDYRDARHLGRYGDHPSLNHRFWDDGGGRFSESFRVSPPKHNSFFDDSDYRDGRFLGSYWGSPPKHNSFWADRDYKDDRFSRSLGISPPSPSYFTPCPSHLTDGPSRDWSYGPYIQRSPERWRSYHTVHDRLSFHSPHEHLPFSFSPPDDSPVFPSQTYGHHNIPNSY